MKNLRQTLLSALVMLMTVSTAFAGGGNIPTAAPAMAGNISTGFVDVLLKVISFIY